MKGILADINIQGQLDVMAARLRAEPWALFWDYLALQYCHFSDIGLEQDTPDSFVWEVCQARQLVLITDNRNKDKPDSLEETIRSCTTQSSLPVFTIGDAQRLRNSREYAERVIEKLLDSLLRIDSLRGTGRLYLP